MGSVAAMQRAAKQIDDAGTGYNQARRWSFFNRETDSVVPRKEGDCSSVCAAIIRMGGYPIDLGYPSHTGVYTGNFVDAAMKAGFTAHQYTGLDALRVGDFVVKPGAHVEFVAGPGTMFSAWMDENGQAHGGSPGDQTGKEVRYTAAFNYPGGWTTVVRPPADNNTPTNTPDTPVTTQEEEEEMKGLTYTTDAGKTRIYMLFNEVSGFYSEFSNGAGKGSMGGEYVNPLAQNWKTGSWPTVTEGHAAALKRSLDAVRVGK